MNAYCEMFCTISKYAGYPEEERREARKAIKAYQRKHKDENVEFEMPMIYSVKVILIFGINIRSNFELFMVLDLSL